MPYYTRRHFLKICNALGLVSLIGPVRALDTNPNYITRTIPKSGAAIPAIGMGSWLTFAVGDDAQQKQQRVEVLRTFFGHGGALIDSSPMYGTSEEVIGYCLKQLNYPKQLFAATKVWTNGWQAGIRQMKRSQHLWGIDRFDLMQIHNLLDYDTHLATLKHWKAEGKIRYIGVTTSHGRRHEELIHIMQTEPALDFVQFTYNIEDREAEQYLLPLAKERQLAVIINRPFQGGGLFGRVQGKPLPTWTKEIDVRNWAQFFLKFIISHPAVTAAIPATTKVEHMRENMGAMVGRLPDHDMRQRMRKYYVSL